MKLRKITKLFILVICVIPLSAFTRTGLGAEVSTSSKLAPIGDTWISSQLPNTNFGSATLLTVSTYKSNYIPDNWYKEAFFLFDLSHFSCHNYAQFAIYTEQASSIKLQLYSSGTSWDENSLTWNNRPSLWNTPLNTNQSVDNGYVFFNVTNILPLNVTSYISLVVEAKTFNINGTYIASKENSSNGPYLACVSSQGVTLNAVKQNNSLILTQNPSIFYGALVIIILCCFIIYRKIKSKGQ